MDQSRSECDLMLMLKIVIIGDEAVGKSSIFSRYCNLSYISESSYDYIYIPTIGVDFRSRYADVLTYHKLQTKMCRCKLHIWDTSGRTALRPVTQSYYKGSHICIVCFDTTKSKPDIDVTNWITDFREKTQLENSMIYVIGTKYDDHANLDLIDININININNTSFAEYITQINDIPNTKFMGFTSAKNNTYVAFGKTDTTKVYSIHAMFMLIVKDYIEKIVYTNAIDLTQEKYHVMSGFENDTDNDEYCQCCIL